MKSIWNTLLLLICFINIGNKSTEIEQDYELINNEIAGYTAGQFNVSDAGSAVYSIPITVPPGTAGMQPSISISYSSHGGNGLMGLGWSLQGISTISRSARTLAQDEEIRGVQLNESDSYSLDGERLVLIDGEYGADDSEYRTEQNVFLRIKAFGSVNGSPQRFRVWTKSGLIMDYGFTTDSRIEAQNSSDILFWCVNRIADTKGNYIRFDYLEQNSMGEYRPLNISYTLNTETGLSPYCSVQFNYEEREDDDARFFLGGEMRSSKRLSSIACYYEDELAREYQFAYESAEYTRISLLKSITECGTDGTCFDPTVFDWKEEKGLGFELSSGVGIPNGHLDNDNIAVYSGDWDGDGVTDMMKFNRDNGNNRFYRNNKNFNFSPSANDLLSTDDIKDKLIRIGDFNADGFTDLYFRNPQDGTNIWFINDGNSFSNLSFTKKDNPVSKSEFAAVNNNELVLDYLGDWNGDGQTDLLLYHNQSGRNHFFLNTTQTNLGGGAVSFTPVNNANNLISPSQIDGGTGISLGDWNKDGLTELMFYSKDNGTNYWYQNTGNGNNPSFSLTAQNPITAGAITGGDGIQLGDWNGDGLIDVMWYRKSDGATKWYYNRGKLSMGSSAFTQVNHVLNASLIAGSGDNKFLYLVDFNGDGADDIVWYNKDNGKNHWFLNDGNCDFSRPLSLFAPGVQGYPDAIAPTYIQNGTTLFFGRFSCEGLLDVMWFDNGNGNNNWLKSDIQAANFVEKITNGHGMSIDIEYESLVDEALYIKENTAVYPEFDFQSDFFVVASFSVDNGIGGKNKTSYCYKGAKTNLWGRGFRGFTEVRTVDEVTGIVNTKFFEKDHRFIGSPLLRTETRLANGTLLNETDYTNDLKEYFLPGASLKAHFAYSTQQVTNNYELDGSLVSSITNRMDYDDYGNVRYSVVDYGDGHIDSTWNKYDEDNIAGWILGRLTRTELHRTAPGQSTVTRVSAFGYDPVSGLLNLEITEPDLPIEQRITKAYEHDVYGNIVKSTVSFHNGTELVNRSVYTTFDDKGRFTLSAYNDLNHTSTTISDPVLGHTLSSTDANGLTITSQYDPFGRTKRVDYPNGNWVTTDYLKCEGDCPPNAVFFTETNTPTTPPTYTYYDFLGREVQSRVTGFNGNQILTTNTFDERGLVEQISDPYFENSTPVWTTINYDEIGREVQRIAPGNRVTTTVYEGLSMTETNPLGQSRTITKNPLGRLVKSIDQEGNTVVYEHDTQGNITKVIDPEGNEISMNYDLYGNKIGLDDPDMGSYQYIYNVDGEMLSQTDPSGNTVTFTYDQLGRVSQRHEPEGTTTWTYDTATNGIGKLASVSSPGGYSFELVYDDLSRIKRENTSIDGELFQISNYYDEFGRHKSIHYPSGFSVKYVYNDNGHLAEVRNNVSNELFWKADQVNARGQITGNTLGNGVVSNFTFNVNTAWLQKITSTNGQSEIQDLSYTYNPLGHLTQRNDLLQNLTENFAYDDLNRLVSSQVVGIGTTSLTYDKLGNITSKSDVGQYIYGENGAGPHQLTSVIGDTSLCLPSSLTAFEFNSFNKVNRMSDGLSNWIELEYGASRQRTRQRTYLDSTLTETKVYVGNLFEKIITDTLTKELHYIRANGEVIGIHNIENTGNTYTHYWHKDHLNSLQSLTDENGTLLSVLSFDAWGKRRNVDGTPLDENVNFDYDRGFTGHEHIDQFGLINMNGRVYDPVLGRFISADPFVQEQANLQSLNRYAYVMNNPLAYTDPSGFWGVSISFGGVNVSVGSSGVKVKGSGDPKDWVKGIDIDNVNPFNLLIDDADNAAKKAFGEENWNTVKVTAATIAVGIATGGTSSLAGAILSGAASGFVGGYASASLSGADTSDALSAGVKGAVIGGITAAATYGVGSLADEAAGGGTGAHNRSLAWSSEKLSGYGVKLAGHGLVQGAAAELSGGKFEHGFYSGVFTAGAEPLVGALSRNEAVQVLASAVVGGTASKLGGGKFSNGAISGAMVTLYNYQMHDGWLGEGPTPSLSKEDYELYQFADNASSVAGKVAFWTPVAGAVACALVPPTCPAMAYVVPLVTVKASVYAGTAQIVKGTVNVSNQRYGAAVKDYAGAIGSRRGLTKINDFDKVH